MARRTGYGLWKQATWESTARIEDSTDPEIVAFFAEQEAWMAEYLAQRDASDAETVADVEKFLSETK